MLKDKELILATRPYAVENRARSWRHFLVTLLPIIAIYVLMFQSSWLWLQVTASVLIGLLLVRMFMIYHDYMHSAIFYKSSIARVFFVVYGLLALAPNSIWKRSHNYHHANNSKLRTTSIGSYPILTREGFERASASEQRLYLFIRHPLTIFFGGVTTFFWGMCCLSFIRNPGKHWDSAVALLLHLALTIGLLVAFGVKVYFLAFLLPIMIAGALGSYLFYAQHNFPGARFVEKEEWTYANAAMNSSSYMQGGPVMRWLTANIGYHHIHHANARIPFYRLPDVYRDIEEFRAVCTTSLKPRDVFACLSMKVWDPETGRMLTRAEMRAYPA